MTQRLKVGGIQQKHGWDIADRHPSVLLISPSTLQLHQPTTFHLLLQLSAIRFSCFIFVSTPTTRHIHHSFPVFFFLSGYGHLALTLDCPSTVWWSWGAEPRFKNNHCQGSPSVKACKLFQNLKPLHKAVLCSSKTIKMRYQRLVIFCSLHENGCFHGLAVI